MSICTVPVRARRESGADRGRREGWIHGSGALFIRVVATLEEREVSPHDAGPGPISLFSGDLSGLTYERGR